MGGVGMGLRGVGMGLREGAAGVLCCGAGTGVGCG
jgi:hypothetical protein